MPDLIIVGASARAACHSAARAGFRPAWVDQFGDEDLRSAFPGMRVAPEAWPQGLVAAVEQLPAAPWMYTGALENHPDVIEAIERSRPLLGNDADTCRPVRDPFRLHDCLGSAGIAAPEVRSARSAPPYGGRWLIKPLRSAGGHGIRPLEHGIAPGAGEFLQQFVHGENRAAVFAGNGEDAVLLGVTRQLVGLAAFHARPFAYCGSTGPLQTAADELAQWRRTGTVLASSFGLKGLFGVDAVVRDGVLIPLEVNPRYTASVEVIERGLDVCLVRAHVDGCAGLLHSPPRVAPSAMFGKAYLFAPADLAFNAAAHEWATSRGTGAADIPAVGTRVGAGAPILTLMVRGEDGDACARLLEQSARDCLSLLI
jgi:predicted ATP-grasp superfamily ATP-dependent carboligase